MTVAETKENVEAAKDFLERHDVHTVECMFADTWGIPRGKRLSAKHFLSTAGGTGFAMANVALTWDMHGVIFPTSFVNDETGYPDMHAVPDLSTLRVAGWREGTAFCICDTHRPRDPRADPARRPRDPAAGGRAGAARRATSRSPRPSSSSTSARQDWQPLLHRRPLLFDRARAPRSSPSSARSSASSRLPAIEVEAWNVEYGPAQVEVNLGHGSAIDVADATMVFKYVVKQIGARARAARDLHAEAVHRRRRATGSTSTRACSAPTGGTHSRRSTTSRRSRSKLMRRYLSGLVAHQLELQPINCPTINAYKRVEDYSFAPTQVSWGLDHRLVGRSVGRRIRATRTGSRPVGVRRRESLPRARRVPCRGCGRPRERVRGSADRHRRPARRRLSDSPPHVTRRCAPGFRAERGSPATSTGTCSSDVYPVMLRHELELFARHVTDWERERYREVM